MAGAGVSCACLVYLLGWDVLQRIYGGDNVPFVLAGVPALTFYRAQGSAFYIHTEHDSRRWIDAAHLLRWAHMVLPLLDRWANAHEFPFNSEVHESTRRDAVTLANDYFGLGEDDVRQLKREASK